MKKASKNNFPESNAKQEFAEGIPLQQFMDELMKLDDTKRQEILDYVKQQCHKE